tara:strand:- start:150 stop:356 length:207 start_codon:yes stop_codon:yes gene_type:complete
LEIKDSATPKNELEAVNNQISQLSQIQTVAQKLKELREKRDVEKKKFDEEVKILAEVRTEINDQKKQM